jgi:hypothetical protein
LESSVLKYKDVQKGTIDQTLSGEVNDINKQMLNKNLILKRADNED